MIAAFFFVQKQNLTQQIAGTDAGFQYPILFWQEENNKSILNKIYFSRFTKNLIFTKNIKYFEY